MTNVMKKAWEIAREGAAKFGGKASEYFVEALRLAWKEVKNKEVSVQWENENGIVIEMTVEHITEKVVGYHGPYQEELTKKVDDMKVTRLSIDGEEVSTWNTRRVDNNTQISTGLVNFKGGEATIKIALPAEINEKVWGAYDARQAKRKEAAEKLTAERIHMNKVYSILECGA